MDAKELRIGNLINAKLSSGKGRTVVHTVTAYNIANIADGVTSSFIFEPIQLTEEWLLKFGFRFENNNYGYSFPEHSDWLLEFNKANNKWWVRYGLEKIDCERLSYVHQLQNLVFALTGEELKLSE